MTSFLAARRAWGRAPRSVRDPFELVFAAGQRWVEANGPQLGASIAFYTMFALAPLLVVTIVVAGAVFGQQAARGQIVGEIEGVVGSTAAAAIEGMVVSAWLAPGGSLAAVAGVVALLLGATGVFGELKRALNAMGRVEPDKRSVLGKLLKARVVAFALLLGLGFLAIASLVISAGLAALSAQLTTRFPLATLATSAVDFALTVLVLSTAFVGLLRWLPDRAPSRRAVWLSALASAVLFALGKSLIGLYLGRASFASSFGAAGSFVVVMLWVYYSAQILLFGAALGRVWDERRPGSSRPCRPHESASRARKVPLA